MAAQILIGDCLKSLAMLPPESVQCCVTSPPYYGLRDYGHKEQIGLEETPDEYVAKMVEVFREVRRVLRKNGTLWLNLGDTYAGSGKGADANKTTQKETYAPDPDSPQMRMSKTPPGCKPKDLIGIPWMTAFALRADGWYLRQDIIWHKPNAMPESVTDRCTKAHEYIFLLSKSAKYFYDHEAVKEPCVYRSTGVHRFGGSKYGNSDDPKHRTKSGNVYDNRETRNRRSVWTITTKPFKGAHFATFPPDLVEPCILAGCPEGGTVLDPFGGSGTTALVAIQHRREAILCELNPEYAAMAQERIDMAEDKAAAMLFAV